MNARPLGISLHVRIQVGLTNRQVQPVGESAGLVKIADVKSDCRLNQPVVLEELRLPLRTAKASLNITAADRTINATRINFIVSISLCWI